MFNVYVQLTLHEHLVANNSAATANLSVEAGARGGRRFVRLCEVLAPHEGAGAVMSPLLMSAQQKSTPVCVCEVRLKVSKFIVYILFIKAIKYEPSNAAIVECESEFLPASSSSLVSSLSSSLSD